MYAIQKLETVNSCVDASWLHCPACFPLEVSSHGLSACTDSVIWVPVLQTGSSGSIQSTI